MEQVLAKKGNALFKVFDGEYSNEFYQYLKKKFAKVKLTKPKNFKRTYKVTLKRRLKPHFLSL